MDVREKLVELQSIITCPNSICNFCEHFKNKSACEQHKKEVIADNMIAHGVTVQDWKPLEAFLHPIDAYKGLKAKYLVFKADTGKRVDNCFILRPEKDAAAAEALRAYAKATDNETLAKDIYNWVGNGVTVKEWISVKDRLPKDGEIVTICTEKGFVYAGELIGDIWFLDNDSWTANVTHWMPMPQPPKGE